MCRRLVSHRPCIINITFLLVHGCTFPQSILGSVIFILQYRTETFQSLLYEQISDLYEFRNDLIISKLFFSKPLLSYNILYFINFSTNKRQVCLPFTSITTPFFSGLLIAPILENVELLFYKLERTGSLWTDSYKSQNRRFPIKPQTLVNKIFLSLTDQI